MENAILRLTDCELWYCYYYYSASRMTIATDVWMCACGFFSYSLYFLLHVCLCEWQNTKQIMLIWWVFFLLSLAIKKPLSNGYIFTFTFTGRYTYILDIVEQAQKMNSKWWKILLLWQKKYQRNAESSFQLMFKSNVFEFQTSPVYFGITQAELLLIPLINREIKCMRCILHRF